MKKTPQKKKTGLSETVRRRVRRIRAERFLTQEALCDRAGISVDAVSRIEGGSRVPTLDTLEKLAHALGVRVVDLIDTGELPTASHTPPVQRIVNVLDDQPPAVQEAAEKIVKAVVQVIRADDRPLLASDRAAEMDPAYRQLNPSKV